MDTVVALNCPGCGAPVATDQEKCRFCKRPIVIQKISEAKSMPLAEMSKYMNSYKTIAAENPAHKSLNGALAVCYINMKMYDKAIDVFDKIMDDNVDNPDLFFNTAVCHLRGKKPFTCDRASIDEVIKYANAANTLQPQALTYLLLAYVKQDYFERKYLRITPSWKDELEAADSFGANEETVKELGAILDMPIPEEISGFFHKPEPAPAPEPTPTPSSNQPHSNGIMDKVNSATSSVSSFFSRFKRR